MLNLLEKEIDLFKKYVKRNAKLLSIAKLIKLGLTAKISSPRGNKKLKPKVLQLPITYNCNSKCVMCNVWKMDHSNEASIDEFRTFMNDPLFNELTDVGINGGEVTLIENLEPYIDSILELPSLKRLNIISNAFRAKFFLEQSEMIFSKCKQKGIEFHISISLDGVRNTHDKVRGVRGAFDKTISAINEIKSNSKKYCDSYNVGCTITNYNVFFMNELDAYCKLNNINIKYRLGIENNRIGNADLFDDFSVTNKNTLFSAREFFHYKMFDENDWYEKFKYFSIFHWLTNSPKYRLLGCIWKSEGATLDSRGDLYYCAVKSKSLGTLRNNKGSEMFFDNDNINYRVSLVNNECNNCIHDYSGVITYKSYIMFLSFILKSRFSMTLYNVMGKVGL